MAQIAELGVARTYADALYSVAVDAKKTKKIADELDEVAALALENRELTLLIESPAVPTKDKQETIEKLFTGKVSPELVNFLCVLVAKRRGAALQLVARVYRHLLNENEGFSSGNVYSAVKLTKKQIQALEKETSKLLNERIRLVNEIDERVIGGVVIFVDGKLIDASIRTELESLREELKKS